VRHARHTSVTSGLAPDVEDNVADKLRRYTNITLDFRRWTLDIGLSFSYPSLSLIKLIHNGVDIRQTKCINGFYGSS